MALVPAQIRAARALLGWSADDLAARAGLPPDAIRRIEAASDPVGDPAAAALDTALRRAGVLLLPADSTAGPGARLRHTTAPDDQGLTPDELNSANDG